MLQINTQKIFKLPYRLTIVATAISAIFISTNTYANNDTNTDITTVIVTGEKIDKDIKDTTNAVTVFDEETYNNNVTQDVNEVATQAPNVVSSGFGAVSIRGLDALGAATGGYALVSGARTRVSTVVDGTTQDWSGYNFTAAGVWDTEQVEVLRGPQSTTQGTSAMAGAVVIKTKDPTFEQESKIRLGFENYENGNLKANVAFVNSGPISEELAYRVAIDGSKGESWINYAQETTELDDSPDFSESENINVRGKLLWEPKSIPKLSAMFSLEHHIYDGEYSNWVTDTETTTQTLSDANGDNVRIQDSQANSFNVDVNYEITDNLTNSTHINYSKSDVHFDEYTGGTEVDIAKETVSVENRVLFKPDNSNLSGVIGVHLSSKDGDIYAVDLLDNVSTTNTAAIYSEVTYALSPSTNLITGLRIENEDVERASGFDWSDTYDVSTNQTYLLPKIGITHTLTDTTTVNASIRKGYSPGGVGFTWDGNYDIYTYDSEEVITYETGTKTRFQNGLTVNTSVFYNDYTDYQAFIDTTYIDNIDAAHSYGLEIEANIWATNNLELRGSLGLLETEIDEYDDFEGNELPSAPTTNIMLGFTQYIGEDLSFGADATYVSESYVDLDNTDDYKAGDYTVFNTSVDYNIGDLTISAYIKNLTDEAIVYVTNGGGSRSYVGQTRTYGMNMTYPF